MRRTRGAWLVAAVVAAGGLAPLRADAAPADPFDVAAAALPPGVVGVVAGQLVRDREPAFLHGVNAYQLGTWWEVNAGCGQQVDDLDAFFAGLPPGSTVRVWAFQELGRHADTGALDLTGLDRVVEAAERTGHRLLMVLADQSGTCDGGTWLDADWYAGGWRRPDAPGRLSFEDWVSVVVPRYAASPALDIWELVNEPEATVCAPGREGGEDCYGGGTCPVGAEQALRAFHDEAGALVDRLDPVHLLALGVIGGSQCGVDGSGFDRLLASPHVDVATVHDYGRPTQALPALLARRLATAGAAGVPLLVEEVGVATGEACGDGVAGAGLGGDGVGGDGVGDEARAVALLTAKREAARQAGAAGWLPWNRGVNDDAACTFDWEPGAPQDAVVVPGTPVAAPEGPRRVRYDESVAGL